MHGGHVPGGVNQTGLPSNVLYAFNPSGNAWTPRAPMPVAGACGASAAIAGKLYVYSPACTGGGHAYPVYRTFQSSIDYGHYTTRRRRGCTT